jgi:type VI secretion system protein ImpA
MADAARGFSEAAETTRRVDAADGDARPDSAAGLDPALASLCMPISEADPCGPDLDLDGDPDYLNFFAHAEVTLPGSFFSAEDGRPFDRTSIDIPGLLAALKPLLTRTRDLRLLFLLARLQILNRDLTGFSTSVAAAAHLIEQYWEAVHPRAQGGAFALRLVTIGALDMSTVIFPLQYVPLCEARRIGTITYRGMMIAMDEVPPRAGEQRHEASLIMEAVSSADPAVLAPVRTSLTLLKASLQKIKTACLVNGQSVDLKSLPDLVGKILALVDPATTTTTGQGADADDADVAETAGEAPLGRAAGPAPASLAQARAALAAIADYYSRCEPSSPALPLIRQAHQLIGKSFFDIINILVPGQMDYAAFRIGNDQVFDLPVGKLSELSEVAPVGSPGDLDLPADAAATGQEEAAASYRVQTRAQAIALLDVVQRFFRRSEPSSPVPMLCERARALAERDFMSVLKDVLPKSALRNPNEER